MTQQDIDINIYYMKEIYSKYFEVNVYFYLFYDIIYSFILIYNKNKIVKILINYIL